MMRTVGAVPTGRRVLYVLFDVYDFRGCVRGWRIAITAISQEDHR